MSLTVAQLTARMTAETSGFHRSMAVANSTLIRTGGIASRVMAGVGIAILGGGIAAARTAGNYEESLNILQAVAEPTAKQMEKLSAKALALGKDFKLPGVSAKDAALSMVELAKGGLSVDQVLSSVRGTIQLAIASEMDMAEAATITARALKAFNLEGKDSAMVADLLAATSNKSTAEIEDLALGFQQASSQFALSEMDIVDMAASLGIMADKGITGSDAGTSLKTMLLRLAAPTGKASDLMDELGIKVFSSKGQMKGMEGIIKSFTKGLSGMTQKQRLATLGTLFGSDAIRGASNILLGGVKQYKQYTKAITKGGEAQLLAEARTKGFNGSMDAFGSAVETFAIELGLNMLPALTEATLWIANLVEGFDPQRVVDFFLEIKKVVVAIVEFIRESTLARTALVALVAGFAAFKIVSFVTNLIKGLAIAFRILTLAMVANPIGLIVIALIALGAALIYAYRNSERFRAVVDRVFNWLKTNVLPTVKEFGKEVVKTFRELFAAAKPHIVKLINFIKTHWDSIKAVALAIWNVVKEIILGVLRDIVIVVRTNLRVLRGVFRVITAALKGDWRAVWKHVKQIFRDIWDGIKALAGNRLDTIKAIIGDKMDVMKTKVKNVLSGIKEAFSSAWNSVVTFITGIPGQIIGIATQIGTDFVRGIADAVANAAQAAASRIAGSIGRMFTSAIPFVGSTPSDVGKTKFGIPFADGLFKGIVLGLRDIPEGVGDAIGKVLEKMRTTIDGFREKFSTTFGLLASDALTAFDAATEAHLTKSEGLLKKMLSDRDVAEFARLLKEAQDGVVGAAKELNDLVSGITVLPEGTDFNDERIRLEQQLAAAKKTLADEEFEAERRRLEGLAEEERKQYGARRTQQRKNFEKRLARLNTQLTLEGTTRKKANKKTVRLLRSFGVDYKRAGAHLGRAFGKGLEGSVNDVASVAHRIAKKVAEFLKAKSPTEKGPMSDLDTWWGGFAETLTRQISKRDLERQLAGVVPGSPSHRLTPVGGSPGSSTPAMTFNNYGPIVGAGGFEELAQKIKEVYVDTSRREGQFMSNIPGVQL